MNIPDAIFPPHVTISTAEKRFVQYNVLCTLCDIVTLRCTGLVVVVHDCLYCILYFVLKIQKIQYVFWLKYFKYINHKVF